MAATWSLFLQAVFMIPRNLYALMRYIYTSLLIFAHPLNELLSPYSLIPLLIISFFVLPLLFCIIIASPMLVIISQMCKLEPSLRFEDYIDMDNLEDD